MQNINIKYKLLNRGAFLIIALVLFSLGMILAAYLVNIPDTYAVGTCATGWRVGATQIINCHAECRIVGKSSGLDFFVPTATAAEWASFITNSPTNAMVSVCTFCQANPDGTSCGATTVGPCGNCTYASDCATSGSGTQTVTTWTCSGGACVSSTGSQACTCTRTTDGLSCGATTVGPCENCTYASDCATSGSGTQTVTTWTCSGGACVSSTGSQACTCTRTTDGTVCLRTHSICISCSWASVCANSGPGTIWESVHLCHAGACIWSHDSEYLACTCLRNTNGECCPAHLSEGIIRNMCVGGACNGNSAACPIGL